MSGTMIYKSPREIVADNLCRKGHDLHLLVPGSTIQFVRTAGALFVDKGKKGLVETFTLVDYQNPETKDDGKGLELHMLGHLDSTDSTAIENFRGGAQWLRKYARALFDVGYTAVYFGGDTNIDLSNLRHFETLVDCLLDLGLVGIEVADHYRKMRELGAQPDKIGEIIDAMKDGVFCIDLKKYVQYLEMDDAERGSALREAKESFMRAIPRQQADPVDIKTSEYAGRRKIDHPVQVFRKGSCAFHNQLELNTNTDEVIVRDQSQAAKLDFQRHSLVVTKGFFSTLANVILSSQNALPVGLPEKLAPQVGKVKTALSKMPPGSEVKGFAALPKAINAYVKAIATGGQETKPALDSYQTLYQAVSVSTLKANESELNKLADYSQTAHKLCARNPEDLVGEHTADVVKYFELMNRGITEYETNKAEYLGLQAEYEAEYSSTAERLSTNDVEEIKADLVRRGIEAPVKPELNKVYCSAAKSFAFTWFFSGSSRDPDALKEAFSKVPLISETDFMFEHFNSIHDAMDARAEDMQGAFAEGCGYICTAEVSADTLNKVCSRIPSSFDVTIFHSGSSDHESERLVPIFSAMALDTMKDGGDGEEREALKGTLSTKNNQEPEPEASYSTAMLFGAVTIVGLGLTALSRYMSDQPEL